MPRTKLLTVVALLAITFTSAACSSGEGGIGGTTAGSSDSDSGSSASTSAKASKDDDVAHENTATMLSYAEWDGKKPVNALHLTEAVELPTAFAGLVDPDWAAKNAYAAVKLAQYQDKAIGVLFEPGSTPTPADGPVPDSAFARVAPDGQITGILVGDEDIQRGAQNGFDLQRDTDNGYYAVDAEDGIAMPSASAGTKENMRYVSRVLPDAFDDHLVWVVLRGGTAIYKAEIRDY